MKLSLIYHVYRNVINLKNSLNSIAAQTNKDFELILINDGATNEVNEILDKYDFSSICKNFKYIYVSENQGHSFSFNEAIKNCESDFVYYLGGNIALLPNFIATIIKVITENANAEVISFSHVIKSKSSLISSFSSLNSDLKFNINPSLRDKVFSRVFLKKNNILLNEQGYFPLEFIYKVMLNFKHWVLINAEIVKYFSNNVFTYNLYDIFQMNNLLINNYSRTTFWKQNKDLIEFLMILYVTRIFLPRIFLIHKDKHIRLGAFNHAKNWLALNIPNWKDNVILNSEKSDLSNESREKILHIFDRSFFKKIFGVF